MVKQTLSLLQKKKLKSYPVKGRMSSLLQNLHEEKVAMAGGLTGKGTALALLPGTFSAQILQFSN